MHSLVIVDADDLYDKPGIDGLIGLKNRVPRLRITLFTIVGRCSKRFLARVKRHNWIDMVPHGWLHANSKECADWNLAQSRAYLDKIDGYGLTHGFKAPGWQISDGMYAALVERGYWVADQRYNKHRRPAALRAYLIDAPNKIHGHLGRALPALVRRVLPFKDADFAFIKDVV